jgi:hypothetical protein
VDDVWSEENPRPAPSVEARRWNDRGVDMVAYLYTTAVSPGGAGSDVTDWPPSAYLMGAWYPENGLQAGQVYDDDGNVLGTPDYPITPDYYEHVLRTRNEAGAATLTRSVMQWQGHSEVKYTQDDQRYSDDHSPFTLRMTRQYVDDANPDWSGWGWVCQMISADPKRDITARAIGIYSDPGHTQFLYTTGAFVDDGQGGYHTVCPVGQRTAEPDPIYYALLLGSAQEGTAILDDPADKTVMERLHWAT